ncbi:MAG: DUF401 family protein [Candidatus Bathyarchaeia archaeon]
MQVFGLLLSLFAIVVLVARRVDYGLALLVGAFILGIFSQLNLQEFVEVSLLTFTDPSTLDLVLIVSLIPILASCMKETGMVDGLIASIKEVLSGRAVLMTLPALMGALPMMGGALLSAPLIDDEAERLGLSSEERSLINVWFRHWNFFVYPLSSVLILLASLTRINIYVLILTQFPPVLIYLLLGYIVSIRGVKEDETERKRDLGTLLLVLLNVSPILIAIALNSIGVHMAAALTAAVAFIFLFKKVSPRRALALLRQGFSWKLPFAMVAVMFLRHMIEYSNSVPAVIPYMESMGLPTNLLLILMTWVIGLVTAMPTASIAIVFPIALNMIKNIDAIFVSILYITMIFSYLVSPMHLCLILTVEYYKSRLHAVYRKFIPASLIAYLISLVIMSSIWSSQIL